LLGELEANGKTILCDMEAGIGTVLRLQPGETDLVLVVAEPSAKAIEVAARSARIAARRAKVLVVANKISTDEDLELITGGVGDHEVVSVPADPEVERADRDGYAPIDAAPSAPAVRALVALAQRLG
jgi:CO dehydrogenase nickel-insertion accessory protein CooC1